jgi:hypothetical protein
MSREVGQGQDTFLDIMRANFGDQDEIRRIREETAADHFVGLLFDSDGIPMTEEFAEDCRATAAEDTILLLGCSEGRARELVGQIEDQMSWEQALHGQA